ncbi:helix-turn-helix domain-containing protein [Brachybacterium sp. UNK5269]|uniref:helix-turn-helix domain-containing protein n=1 Tax=Brachybacterium sp. UNK5269 TaxID=3408576 RepID=UPI003BAF444F
MAPRASDDIERAHLRDPTDRTFVIARRHPPPHLRGWIRRYWIPVWDVPDGEVAEQRVLQYPVCLAAISPAYSRLIGPNPGLSTTVLAGRSWAFGTMFAPAAGAVLARGPVSDLAGTWCDLEDVPALVGLTAAVRALMSDLPEDREAHARCAALIEQRAERLGEPQGEDRLVNELVELVEQDQELLTVKQLCAVLGIGERSLQRLTARRLGLSPLWLIRRRRLQEAADGLRGPEALSDLAARLGYADQAHFARDFRTSTGLTPGAFARRWRDEPAVPISAPAAQRAR